MPNSHYYRIQNMIQDKCPSSFQWCWKDILSSSVEKRFLHHYIQAEREREHIISEKEERRIEKEGEKEEEALKKKQRENKRERGGD